MREQNKKEKVLQMMNLMTINKYIQKMLISKTKKLNLKSQNGLTNELMLLEDFTNLLTLEDSKN